MKHPANRGASILILVLVGIALPRVNQAQMPAERGSTTTGPGLTSFSSDAELAAYLRRVVARHATWTRAEAERERIKRVRRDGPLSCDDPKRRAAMTIVSRWPSKPGLRATTDVVIKGRVTDLMGNTIPSGNVMIPGSQISATTSANASYRLQFSAAAGDTLERRTIVARRIGYAAVSGSINLVGVDSARVDFKMCQDVMRLDQLIVTGLGDFSDARELASRDGDGQGEGGKVKLHRDHLVLLHRGRLFTVSLRDGDLREVSSVAALAPGINPDDATQDQLFVSGDKAVITGFNNRHGIELTVFDISREGDLRYHSAYHIRSKREFYYKADYLARLSSGRLNVYTETDLPADIGSIALALPALRKWAADTLQTAFQPIATPASIYRSARPLLPADPPVIHALTSCDVSAADLACRASAVVGTSSYPTYDSQNAIYAWSSEASPAGGAFGRHIVIRLPFDGSRPSGLEVKGAAIGRDAFFESDGYLSVLLRQGVSTADDEALSKLPSRIKLLRVPVSAFSRQVPAASSASYKTVASTAQVVTGPTYANGFVEFAFSSTPGDFQGGSVLTTVSLTRPGVTRDRLPHLIGRLDALTSGSIAVSSPGEDIHFTSLQPVVTGSYTMRGQAGATQEATGMSFSVAGSTSGVVAFVVRSDNTTVFDELSDGVASVVFLKVTSRGFDPVGRLDAKLPTIVDDGCKSTCVDWYHNAKAVFVGDRILVVFGYELVEAALIDGKIVETRRIDIRSPD